MTDPHTKELATTTASNIVFDLINQSFQFNQKCISVILDNDKPWFCGKEVAMILGYKDSTKAIRDHVRDKNKVSMEHILKPTEIAPLKGNLKNTLYINEPGVI